MTEIIARRQFAPLYIWLAIGVLVQFGWEAGLLPGGIRSAGFASFGEKLRTLTVNSLLETNLGMPYVYAIFTAYSAKFTEQLRRRAHRSPSPRASRRITANGPAGRAAPPEISTAGDGNPSPAVFLSVYSALSIVPPPRATSPSYKTAACPGVTARCGSSKSTRAQPSGSAVTTAGCSV